MRLYSVGRSPFAARVRAIVYYKQLDIELAPPPDDGLKGAAYLALNPLGRLPVLVLDDGTTLPESEIIDEYLQDRFPEPSLRPASPELRARSRLLARIGELYVMAPLFELFAHIAPAGRDGARVDALFGQIGAGLRHLEHYLDAGAYAVGPAPSVADAALPPFLFWAAEVARIFERPAALGSRLERYRDGLAGHLVFGRVVDEMTEDLAALRRG